MEPRAGVSPRPSPACGWGAMNAAVTVREKCDCLKWPLGRSKKKKTT